MSDLISRKALVQGLIENYEQCMTFDGLLKFIHEQHVAYDTDNELRLLKNYLDQKPKTYRQRNQNFVVVRDLLMRNTAHQGMTSCIMKCHELGIDPYGYSLEGADKDE